MHDRRLRRHRYRALLHGGLQLHHAALRRHGLRYRRRMRVPGRQHFLRLSVVQQCTAHPCGDLRDRELHARYCRGVPQPLCVRKHDRVCDKLPLQ